MIQVKSQIKIALIYFLIAAAFGLVLRSLHVFDFDLNYRFIVHGHSHIALLGWVYLCLTTLLYKCFIQKSEQIKRKRQREFLFTQATLLGMIITFPMQGYALFSIVFSTLFLFASYWFTVFFFKNIPSDYKNLVSYPYIKASLYYLVISSIGPWALGGIMATLGPSSIWYRLAIYFYLHFQCNAWMLFVLLGLLIYIFERQGIVIPREKSMLFLRALNISVVLTLFLSALWTNPSALVYVLSGAGGILQIICFVIAAAWVNSKWTDIKSLFSGTEFLIFKIVIFALAIKLLLQFLGTIPYFANLSATIIELTIAYLHWIFLGVTSMGLFLVLSMTKLIKISSKNLLFYLVGFSLTEGLIFYKGIIVWTGKALNLTLYNEILFAASLILFLSITSILLSNVKGQAIAQS